MKKGIYRGKNLKKEWIEGYFFAYPEIAQPMIIHAKNSANGHWTWEYVQSETVGICTDMADRAGTRIYEHDIIKDVCTGETGIIRFGGYRNLTDTIYTEHIGIYVEWKNPYMKKDIGFWVENGSIEVIGNIFDNISLAEGGKEDVSGSHRLQETSEMACAPKT